MISLAIYIDKTYVRSPVGAPRMESDIANAEELRKELKEAWASLWNLKYDDPIAAEGVSLTDFPRLFVEGGEIMYATKDYKPISFREVLEKYFESETMNRISIDPRVGGWKKFSRTHFPAMQMKRERPKFRVDLSQHQRKGGDGWLNKNRIAHKRRLNL